MLASRLLKHGAGSGGFTPTPQYVTAESLALIGFWNNVSEPRAATHNGKTYIGYINDANELYVTSYDHATATTSTAFKVGEGFTSPNGAIHNSIGLVVRSSDDRILLVENEEDAAQPFWRLSTNAEDATAWGTATQFGTSGEYDYSTLCQLANGDLYWFSRNTSGGVGYLSYSKSTNGGTTWSARTHLVTPLTTGNLTDQNYWRIGVYGSTMHLFITDTDRQDANPSSVYHMTFDGTTLRKSDGTSLGTTFPVSVDLGTLAHDDSAGSSWAEGWCFDENGYPSAVILAYDSGNTRNNIRFTRWTGSAWVDSAIAHSNGVIASNRFIAGAAIDKAAPGVWTVYANVKVGSYFELFRYRSSDGTTWATEQITSGSAAHNAMPDTPLGATDVRLVWGRGTYTNDDSFSFTVYVLT